jgi:DNA repair protein RecN
MLKSLQIRNYVLIDSLEVSFPEGLIIISGQTGAGKSILLGALSLLLGEKVDASVIGSEADTCVVEATFMIPASDCVMHAILDENELECEDGELIVRRVVNRSGRSRSFVNDSPVSIPVLQSITSRLIDIHSQHQTILLSDHAFQLSMLDHFAGNVELLSECGDSFRQVKSVERELDALTSKLEKLQEERDYSLARYQKLAEANLQQGELESLETEQKQLANAEEIKQGFCTVEELFNPSDPSSGAMSVSSVLKEAQKQLEKAGHFVPEALELAERVGSSRMELEDVLEDVSSINSRTELSQDRLEAVENRLSLLYELMKKYSASSVEELISKRDALSDALFDSDSLEARKNELENALESRVKEYEGICARLHQSREKAAAPFSDAICQSVRSLELEYAGFGVELSECQPSVTGTDSVRFLFSATGTNLTDVARCASGGELSRLMLCLKAMMARFVSMPTLVFDEIDTGVSGSVADKMGRMICSMGKDMQVFSITHLPQVAAKGKAHYLVEKEYDVLGTKATSSLRQISGEERVMEIARMLSGSTITKAAIENAKELLG